MVEVCSSVLGLIHTWWKWTKKRILWSVVLKVKANSHQAFLSKSANILEKKSNFGFSGYLGIRSLCVSEPRVHYRNETKLTTIGPWSPSLSWASALRKHANILNDIWLMEGTMAEWNHIAKYWSSGTWCRTAQLLEKQIQNKKRRYNEKHFDRQTTKTSYAEL